MGTAQVLLVANLWLAARNTRVPLEIQNIFFTMLLTFNLETTLLQDY